MAHLERFKTATATFLRSKWTAAGAAMLALSLFALQPVAYRDWFSDGLLFPTLIAVGFALGLGSGQLFAAKPGLAALAATIGAALFAWGEAYADAGLDNTLRSPLPWWSEKVAAVLLVGGPIVIGTAVLTAVLTARSWRNSPTV